MLDHTTKLLDQFVVELSDAASMSLVQQETEVPFTADDSRGRLDARLRMTLPLGNDVELAVEVMRAGYPRDVRLAVHRLRAYQAARPASAVPRPLRCEMRTAWLWRVTRRPWLPPTTALTKASVAAVRLRDEARVTPSSTPCVKTLCPWWSPRPFSATNFTAFWPLTPVQFVGTLTWKS